MRACDYSVFKIEYTTRQQVRKYEGMDSEFSHWEYNVPRAYFCVAPNILLAKAMFNARYGMNEFVDVKSCQSLCTLDDIMTVM